MAITIIHVNRHLIAKNRKDGQTRPVYSVKSGREIVYGHAVSIEGGTTDFVDPRKVKPLQCGATIYAIVTGGRVTVIDPISFKDIG